MTKPKWPRTRYSVPLILAVGGLSFYLSNCLGWPQSTISAGGLLLDIAGATVIAIPDVPLLHSLFFSGKLRNAFDHLQLTRGANESVLVEPGTREELVDSLYVVENVSGEALSESSLLENVVHSPEPSSVGFYELRQKLKEMTNDAGYDRVFGFKVYRMDDDSLGAYILWEKDGNPEIKSKSKFRNPFDRIERVISDSNARFRRMGLSMLIAGFLLQMYAVLV